jgi:pyrimidine deaminase RibD-like protein
LKNKVKKIIFAVVDNNEKILNNILKNLEKWQIHEADIQSKGKPKGAPTTKR